MFSSPARKTPARKIANTIPVIQITPLARAPSRARNLSLYSFSLSFLFTDVAHFRRTAGFQTCLKTHAWPRTRNQALASKQTWKSAVRRSRVTSALYLYLSSFSSSSIVRRPSLSLSPARA
jgi:hypothetical protein